MKKVILKSSITAICIIIVAAVGIGFAVTPVTGSSPNESVEGIKPFHSSSGTGSNYYRIPSMLTTSDGTVIAAIDARFGGTADSPNNLDTAVSLSYDSGATWSESFLALSFEDYENTNSILKADGSIRTENSASAIDPSLLQDKETGRIFMLVDVFPYGCGAFASQKGSGYTEINGQNYLALRQKGEDEYNYTVRENGAIFDKDGNQTEYSLNSKYEILENGIPFTVKQKKVSYWYNIPFSISNRNQVPMNIMYQDALFQPLGTSYLYLIYSDDSGKSWSDPVNLNAQVKSDEYGFMGVCPGRGIQIESGDYAGRLIFPVYYLDSESGEQEFAVIYSDDNGGSWRTGSNVPLTSEVNNISETQIVQFPNGNLQAFSRTTAGYVASAISTDGGESWSESLIEKDLPLSGGSGCMISAINYNGKIDGKDAVILSAPAADDRKNGYIYVGLIHENADKYNIEWTYKKEITDENTNFAYSCLTQLPNGNIGLLYEKSNAPQTIDTVIFESYSTEELCETAINGL